MPCMCGDLYCMSCGPAQGNYRCPACGKWSDEGGCDSPAECDKIMQSQYEAEHRSDLVCTIWELVAEVKGVAIWDWAGSSPGQWERLLQRPIEKLEHTRNSLRRKLRNGRELSGAIS